MGMARRDAGRSLEIRVKGQGEPKNRKQDTKISVKFRAYRDVSLAGGGVKKGWIKETLGTLERLTEKIESKCITVNCGPEGPRKGQVESAQVKKKRLDCDFRGEKNAPDIQTNIWWAKVRINKSPKRGRKDETVRINCVNPVRYKRCCSPRTELPKEGKNYAKRRVGNAIEIQGYWGTGED